MRCDCGVRTWGLFRHYWVVTKLLLTVLATIILLVHTQPIDRVAAVAAQTTLATGDLRQLRIQLVGDACAALFVLLVTTTLSVYKPWGMTSYGLRKQNEETGGVAASHDSTSRALGQVRAPRDHRSGPARSPLASCRHLGCTPIEHSMNQIPHSLAQSSGTAYRYR